MTTFADGENGLSVRTKINDVLQHMDGTAGTLVVNEAGADVDFRVESDTNANALFVDGATGNVGIGLSGSGDKFDVNGTSFFRGNMGVFSPTGGAVSSSALTFGSAALANAARIFSNTETSTAGTLVFQTAQAGTGTLTERMRINADGNVGIGTTSPGFYSGRLTVAGGNLAIAEGYEAIFWNAAGTGRASIQGVGTHEMAFFTNVSERMRITAAGSVVVGGTTAVLASANRGNITVSGSLSGIVSVGTSTAAYSYFYHDATGAEIWNNQNTYLRFGTSNQERMRIDSAGNMGLGVTPSAWGTGKAIEVGAAGNAIWADAGYTTVLQNTVFSSGAYRYVRTAAAARLDLEVNSFKFFNAPSGTAGGTITFTQAMTLDASGNLGIGTATPSTKLHLVGSSGIILIRLDDASNPRNNYLGVDNYEQVVLSANESSTVGATPAIKFRINATEGMRIDASRRVLIGTTSASGANLLQVNSDALINSFTVGRGAGGALTNVAFGASALVANTTGVSNTALGSYALSSNTSGGAITAVGNQAAVSNTIGVNLTAIGYNALFSNTTGNNNTAIGQAALFSNVGGSSNIAIGRDAGNALTTGSSNTIIGSIAGTAGLANTVILGAGTTERLRIDSNGNMGLGIAPAPWNSAVLLASQVASASISAPPNSLNDAYFSSNAYYSDSWRYIIGGSASQYRSGGGTGSHQWLVAPAGTAGAAITFTQAMTLDASGRLGIGTTSPTANLQIGGVAGGDRTFQMGSSGATRGVLSTNGSGTFAIGATNDSTAGSLIFQSGGALTERMRINELGDVGIGTASPNASSILDVQSTTKGVRFPNMTTTQKNAIANVAGNVIFDTTLGKLCVNTGSGWQTITSA